jgi:cephalosporin hydroxylase
VVPGMMEENLSTPADRILEQMQARIVKDTTYFGVRAIKCPLDAWVYQEIIYDTRPDLIVELGTFSGGGALYLAHLCDLLDHGAVISVDISQTRAAQPVRDHPRIRLIESEACAAFPMVRDLVHSGDSVLVIEDSAHTFDNTINVLRTYQELIQPGGYFIVEDGICHHGLDVGPSPGPYEAVEAFLSERDDFEADREREAFFLTWNPKGFLRRVA